MNILVILIWISLLLQIISISTPNWSTSEYKQQIFGKNMTIKQILVYGKYVLIQKQKVYLI